MPDVMIYLRGGPFDATFAKVEEPAPERYLAGYREAARSMEIDGYRKAQRIVYRRTNVLTVEGAAVYDHDAG